MTRIKNKRIMEQHTVTLLGKELIVQSVTVTEKKISIASDAELRHRLDKMVGWRPWDNFCHVIESLKRDRTYMINRGPASWAGFTNRGSRE